MFKMNRLFLSISLVTTALCAESFETLLQRAIENSSRLEISLLKTEQKQIEGEILTRYENPNIEFEVANFSGTDIGTKVGVSQSLLLPSVKRDKRVLSQNRVELSKESYKLLKSEFIYNFSMHYLDYKKAVKEQELQSDSIAVTKKILYIAKERYERGTGTKSEYLQTKVDYTTLLNLQKELKFKSTQELNTLQKIANIQEEIELDSTYSFSEMETDSVHPLLSMSERQRTIGEARLKLASHSIETIELFSEIEKEPEEDIFRVGVSIPLPIFNDKSQEKQLAKIEIANQNLLLDSQQKALSIEIGQLRIETDSLKNLQQSYQDSIVELRELLEMYQKGYSIAKVALLKLQESKKQLIQTENRVLETAIAIERNIIKINYLKGAYSE